MRSLLHGPPPPLPRVLDAAAEGWAGMGSRSRALLVGSLVVALLAVYAVQLVAVDRRWGGPPVPVWRVVADQTAGEIPDAEQVHLPPLAVPDGALARPPGERALAVPVVAGTVLTEAHLDPRGPAARLPPDQRILPVPVEPGWQVVPGGLVDVWVLSGREAAAELVAAGRPVLAVTNDSGQPVALVALHAGDMAAATAGLATGRLVLAHAPDGR